MFSLIAPLLALTTGKAHDDAGSCASYGCVSFTPTNACQCNPSCAKWNSCCDDYEATCVAPPPPPMPPLSPGGCSVGAEGWPDVEVVCGECKALIDRFDEEYKTCTGFCLAVGRACVDAWEESSDSCTVKYDADCDTEIPSSDAMCECGDELPTKMKASKAKAERAMQAA